MLWQWHVHAVVLDECCIFLSINTIRADFKWVTSLTVIGDLKSCMPRMINFNKHFLCGFILQYVQNFFAVAGLYWLLTSVFPNLFDVAVPLASLFISPGTPWGKHLFFKLICFLIISYMRDKGVYCCWVSIYALINDVILFIYFLFLHLAVPLGSVAVPTPVWNHWLTYIKHYMLLKFHVTNSTYLWIGNFFIILQLKYDVVVSAYTLLELPSARSRLETIISLWNKTNKYLIIVEQGTNAGFKVRIGVNFCFLQWNIFCPATRIFKCWYVICNMYFQPNSRSSSVLLFSLVDCQFERIVHCKCSSGGDLLRTIICL
jgi:hypothetical protein